MFKRKILFYLILVGFSGVTYAEELKSNKSNFDGFVSVGLGYGNSSGDASFITIADKKSGINGELRGSFSYDHESGFGVQLDNQYTLQRFSDVNLGANDLVAHLYYRDPRYLAGIFGQRRTFDASQSGLNYSVHLPLARNFYGVEGQVYINELTLYGQLGAQDSSQYYYYDRNPTGFIGSLEARYFPQDNMKINAGYQYGVHRSNYWVYDSDNKTKSSVFSLGVEYQLNNTPLSVFANLQYASTDASYLGYSGDAKSTRGLVGVKFNFGKGSLLDRDRHGVTLNPIRLDNSLLAIGVSPS